MPFQGSGAFSCPSDHPLGPYPVVCDDVAGVMLVPFMELGFTEP